MGRTAVFPERPAFTSGTFSAYSQQIEARQKGTDVTKAKQVSVWVSSSPGQIARVARALARARVDITAFASYGSGDEIPVRLLVDSPTRARKVLRDLDLRVTEEDVLRLTLPDKPGILAELAERLAGAHININYSYATVAKGAKKSDLVLAVSDIMGAVKVLKGL